MKSDFLKKIIAATVITTSIGTLVPAGVSAVDFYTWQNASSQSNGYWQKKGSQWYFYDNSGILKTGWIYDKGLLYYADNNGVMQTGVIQVEGTIYLFDNNGAMQTGNAVVDGKYYTFNEKGAAVGSNVPKPVKGFGATGEPTMPYTPGQVVRNEDSSPDSPNTIARDPQNLVKYIVRFRDDDGDDLRNKSIEKGEEVSLYTPTKKGYKFVEWNTKEDGDGTSYDVDEKFTVNHDISLYAQWEEVSSDSGNTSSGDKVLVEEIEISSSSSSITANGGTLQMSVNILPIDTSNKSVTWSVQNGTGKATISSSGLLTASENGTVIVIATAADSSKVTGKYNVKISGQVATGGNTGGNTGGETTTGGNITAFDPDVRLTDVVINNAGNIVDLPLLKTSGKLPTTAKVKCSLSDGTTKEIEIPIKNWSGTFDGTQAANYTLSATLGALPTGYTSTATLPNPTVKVIVQTPQVDGRLPITGVDQASSIILNTDKHIVTSSVLFESGILPSTVTLNYAGGTVTANVKSWSFASGVTFDGKVPGSYNLEAIVDMPAGYVLPSNIKVTTTLVVQAVQTANIQTLVEVIRNADRTDGKALTLNYAVKDKLDLTNLLVKVKYNDGTEGNIPYSRFGDYGITTGYFQNYPLDSVTSFMIPVEFNGKSVYSETISVSKAAAPTVTTSQAVTINISDPSTFVDATLSYTLGTGTMKANGVKSVNINNTLTLTKETQYKVDPNTNTITIDASAFETFYNAGGKITPSTYSAYVVFEPAPGTSLLSPSSIPIVHFISKPSTPANIDLAPNTAVKALDNTIKLKGLQANVSYEYCVVTTTGAAVNWTSAKSFGSTTTEKELTDVAFTGVAGNEIVIRKKAESDGKGANNLPSEPIRVQISPENIARTFSTEKSITSFSLKYTGTPNVVRQGTITEGSSSGTISVIMPEVVDAGIPKEVPVNSLEATIKTSPSATVDSTHAGADGNVIITNSDFSNTLNQVKYTVKAENGTTKVYTATLYKTILQQKAVRSDVISYLDTIDSNGTQITTTASVNIYDAYTAAGIAVGGVMTNGLVDITVPSLLTPEQKKALEVIRKATPDATNHQIGNVEMILTKPTMSSIVVSVKVANSLEELKSATAISLSSITSPNVKNGQYYEMIPVVVNSGADWSKVTQTKTKYYQWIDAKGNVQYTSLMIVVK